MKHPSLVDFYFKRAHFYDLIKTKHNSNHNRKQITLDGEILREYSYYCFGFVPADEVRLKEGVWFSKLSDEQIKLVDKFLESKKCAWG